MYSTDSSDGEPGSSLRSSTGPFGKYGHSPMKVSISNKYKNNSELDADTRLSSTVDETRKLALRSKSMGNTTSQISHAQDILKKFDNKYKIRAGQVTKIAPNIDESTSVGLITNIEPNQVANNSNLTREIITKKEQREETRRKPKFEIPYYVREHTNDEPPEFEESENVDSIESKVAAEKYDSDFESIDSESDLGESDNIQDDKSQNSMSSDSKSSIHTTSVEESPKENAFANLRLFSFSDLNQDNDDDVSKPKELTVPVRLHQSSFENRSPKKTVFEIDENKKMSEASLAKTSTSRVDSNVDENWAKLNETTRDSSDQESISELISQSIKSSLSGMSIEKNSRPKLIIIQDLDKTNGSDLVQDPKNLIISKEDGDISMEEIFPLDAATEDDFPEVIETDFDEQSVSSKVRLFGDDMPTDGHSKTNQSTESDESVQIKKRSHSKRPSATECLGIEAKSGKEISGKMERKQQKGKSTETQNQNLKRSKKRSKSTTFHHERKIQKDSPHREKSAGKKKSKPKFHEIGIQTVSLEHFEDTHANHQNRKSKPPVKPPTVESLNMSWDFDEVDDPPRALNHISQNMNLSAEVLEALAVLSPVDDAISQLLKQQISLTRHFMASQYKMYKTYTTSIRELTEYYSPVTLEDTKEFIRIHKRSRVRILD